MAYGCTVELLGGLRILSEGGSVTRFRTQKTAALLAYLAYNLDRQHPREELVELFWPGFELDSGRMSLRTCLASLRRELRSAECPEEALIADRTFVRLNEALIDTDVRMMSRKAAEAERSEDSVRRAELFEEAAGIYKGPLVPGLYDDWATPAREHLQLSFQNLLIRTAEAIGQTGQFTKAIDYAKLAIAIDPLSEEPHRALLRLYAESGQPADLVRHYRSFRETMRQELGVHPSADTRELYRRLSQEGEAAEPESRPTTPTEMPATARRQGSRLPAGLSAFFGREREMSRLLAAIGERARLVTVTGPGGSGKTRLVLEAARKLQQEERPIWFVPLADVAGPEFILDAVLRATGLHASAENPALETIASALAAGPALLILDNFEHLFDGGNGIVADLLARAPSLDCIVTSRHKLGIDGERHLPLNPLPVPTLPGRPEWLERFASVRLFVDRARAANPDFELTPSNAPAVAALCERLEGVPLALELAASWSQVLTPAKMLARSLEGTELLGSGAEQAESRQRTLRLTFEWSYDLLSPELQRLCSRLSIFRGGWTASAAEQVCGDPAPDENEGRRTMLRHLRALSDRSIVSCQQQGEESRFHMLEFLRQSAAARLEPQELAATEERLETYFLVLAVEGDEAMDGENQAFWIERLEGELDNFRAVMGHLTRSGKCERALRLAITLSSFMEASGRGEEALKWLDGILGGPGGEALPAPLRADALLKSGRLLQYQRFDRSVLVLEQSLAIYRELGDRSSEATALRMLACARMQMTRNHADALVLLGLSLDLSRQLGDERGIASTLAAQAGAYREMGDLERARTCYDESLELHRRLGDFWGIASIGAEMGYMLHEQGRLDQAEALLQESLDLSKRLSNRISIGHALWLLGRLERDRGNSELAQQLLEDGLAHARQTASRQQAVNCLVDLGTVLSRRGDHLASRMMYAEAIRLARDVGNRMGLVLPLRLDARAALELGEFVAARDRILECLSIAKGKAPTVAIHCLEWLSVCLARSGDTDLAATVHAAAEAARHDSGLDVCEDPCVTAAAQAYSTASAGPADGHPITLEEAVELVLGAYPSAGSVSTFQTSP